MPLRCPQIRYGRRRFAISTALGRLAAMHGNTCNAGGGMVEIEASCRSIFSAGLDVSVAHMGLEVIKTPVRSPQANSLCERLIGTLRRECLDWIIPLCEEHLRKTLGAWLAHYNRGRPHSSLGPGLPDPPVALPVPLQHRRHRFDRASRVVTCPVLNGLHYQYSLVADAA